MKKTVYMGIAALICTLVITLNACIKDEKDMTPPVITDAGITANPINCQVYHPGEVIPFLYVFTDDTELGSFNIEIHGNFDHHSHSTEADSHNHEEGECEHHHNEDDDEHDDEGKAWVYNQSFDIPAGQRSYRASSDIPIPTDIRHGDYHFMIRLTDSAGWQQLKAIAIIID